MEIMNKERDSLIQSLALGWILGFFSGLVFMSLLGLIK